MKRVLLISYHFPPDSEVGGLRAQKYAKYLPLYGWKPIVLTVHEKYYPKKDYDRMGDVKCEIHRTDVLPGLRDLYLKAKEIAGRFRKNNARSTADHSPESLSSLQERNEKGIRRFILDLMCLPDDRTGWIMPAVFAALKLIRTHSIDTILTTSPPHSVQITGLCLKLLLRKKWVIDFRDPWSLSLSGSSVHNVEKWLERKVVMHADTVITATDAVRDHLVRSYPELPPEKFVCIPNGFDLEDFRNIRVQRNGIFSITYIGDLYIGRSPEVYLRAVSELMKEKEIDPERIRLKFIGRNVRYVENRPMADLLRKYGLERITDVLDAVPYSEAIRHMQLSDVLVVLSPQNFVHPTKTFEYMACGAYVMAFTPPGTLSELVSRYARGFVIGLDDYEKTKATVRFCYRQKQEGRADPGDSELGEYVMSYDRKNLTKQLTQYL